MTVVDDYNFTGLYDADPTMARILCSSYIAFASIVILNLLIALLSDTFQRVYENAIATAVMQRGQTIISIEESASSEDEEGLSRIHRERLQPRGDVLRRDSGQCGREDHATTEGGNGRTAQHN